MTNSNFDNAIEQYGKSAKAATVTSKMSKATMVGFGAAAAGGMFAAQQADADVVYSGIVGAGFAVSTVNASSTNALNRVLFPIIHCRPRYFRYLWK